MTFDLEVNGEPISVSVEPLASGRYRVGLEGRSLIVDAARVGQFGYSVLFEDDGALSQDVHVTPAERPGAVLVSLEGRTAAVTVGGRRRTGRDQGSQRDGEQRIVAPMPGRIVRVLAGTGDQVTARQPIVVVEAMKMENELRSPKAGRVKEITVAAGASVEAGRVLAVIE